MAQLVLTFLMFFLLVAPLDAKGPQFRINSNRGNKNSVSRSLKSELLPGIPNKDSGPVGLQAPLRWSDDQAYVLELEVGTPARNVSLIVDTTDEFIWNDCLQSSLLQIGVPPYYPNSSSSYRNPPCDSQQWNDTLAFFSCDQLPRCRYNCTWAVGVLANETFQFGGSAPPLTLSFGCNDVTAFNYSYSTGYAGIGRGPLSLISQLLYSKFSYCFTDAFNDTLSSYMFFGSFADLDDNVTDVSTTTLIQEDSTYYYYLDLKGISVGSKRLSISPETLQYVANSSGTIMSTAYPLTTLVPEAYASIKEEVMSLIDLPLYNQSQELGLDLCFDWTSGVPLNGFNMTFHFSGANMTVPFNNLFWEVSDDNGTYALCLIMTPSTDSYSYLGSFLQQNLQFIYDLQNAKLSFRSVDCDRLPPHKSGASKFDLRSTTFCVILLLYLLLV